MFVFHDKDQYSDSLVNKKVTNTHTHTHTHRFLGKNYVLENHKISSMEYMLYNIYIAIFKIKTEMKEKV